MSNLTARIQRHYDVLAPLYFGLWGRHIHHGFWHDALDTAPPTRAQERLMHEILAFADCPAPRQVLDIGCGFAGSLIWLGQAHGVAGSGFTISPWQCLLGRLQIRRAGLQNQLQVQLTDAQQPWALPDNSVDLVWCVECSEHLADRAHLAREARRVLRPGGVLVLAAWLAGASTSPTAGQLRAEVASGMLCYPFDDAKTYAGSFEAAGLSSVRTRLITPNVLRTWDLGMNILDLPGMNMLSHILGDDVTAFTNSFTRLRQAYQEGAMEYGLVRGEVAHG